MNYGIKPVVRVVDDVGAQFCSRVPADTESRGAMVRGKSKRAGVTKMHDCSVPIPAGGEHGNVPFRLRRMQAAVWRRAAAGGLSLFMAYATVAVAQTYPVKPVRLIVGPGPDAVPRIFAQRLSEVWGHTFVVDPRPGVGGALAAETVARAQPDGYTLLWVTSAHPILSAFGVGAYDLTRDYAPIAMTITCPYILVVNPALPVRSAQDLVALAKAQPGKLNYASAGSGSSGHLAGELLRTIARVEIVHVPYKTVAGAMTELAGGQIQFLVQIAAAVRGLAESGKIRALAVTTLQRSNIFPELPTMVESGFPGFEMTGWNGFLAPAGAPAAIVAQINAEVNRALKLPEITQRVNSVACEPLVHGSTPASFGAFMKSDVARYRAVVKESGAKAD